MTNTEGEITGYHGKVLFSFGKRPFPRYLATSPSFLFPSYFLFLYYLFLTPRGYGRDKGDKYESTLTSRSQYMPDLTNHSI